MSFKRDESDPGPLGALQRRRVAELLASAIPEDEALLLRDGRPAPFLRAAPLSPGDPRGTPGDPAGGPRCAGPAAGPDAPPGPERSADNGPVQQLLQERQDEGQQQLPGRDPRDDPKEFPEAAGAVTEPRERRECRERRKPRAQRGRCPGRPAGKEREFPKSQRGGAEPRAAADPAAPPAPAQLPLPVSQPGLAPGSRWELGQGRQRRVRLRRGGAATAAASLTPPGVPRCPQSPGNKVGIFWDVFAPFFHFIPSGS
ncbi:sodium channel modifier 1 isoform X8 [Zonotrichia albicollis]|uniref:sodium channel modifier 1 isoform X8 n=1 Tax=Zonotrichia albicollis TaxID=44394 RepID=UPI003D810137